MKTKMRWGRAKELAAPEIGKVWNIEISKEESY